MYCSPITIPLLFHCSRLGHNVMTVIDKSIVQKVIWAGFWLLCYWPLGLHDKFSQRSLYLLLWIWVFSIVSIIIRQQCSLCHADKGCSTLPWVDNRIILDFLCPRFQFHCLPLCIVILLEWLLSWVICAMLPLLWCLAWCSAYTSLCCYNVHCSLFRLFDVTCVIHYYNICCLI